MSEPILVSIRCTVYNHAPYLRQCLEGFVKQKTNFKFEAFVHDDASTDGSADIILEYANKYPEIIKPYIEKENLYSKKNGSFIKVTYSPLFLKGKYIALCEGDDYWTDPLKLQKQIGFMEEHPECAMSFGNAIEHWEDGIKPDKVFSDIENRDYSAIELSDRWIVPTATIVFRKDVLQTSQFLNSLGNPKIMAGDLPICLSCATLGKIHAFSDSFAVYRRTPQGFWRSLDAEGRIRMGDDRMELFRIFGKQYKNSTILMALYHYQRAWQLARDEKRPSIRNKAIHRICSIAFRFPRLGWNHFRRILKERQ